MTETEAAYLAGLIDGEGSILIVKINKRSKKGYVANPSYSVVVVVNNSDPKMMRWCQGRGAIVKKTKPIGTWTFRRPMYRAIWSTRNAASILRNVSPFLVTKQRQALLALQLSELLEERFKKKRTRLTKQELLQRETLKQQVHGLNQQIYKEVAFDM